MRVVFLTHNYPREPGDVSGAFLATLAGALCDRGVEVTVVAPSDRGRGGVEQTGGIRIRRVRYAAASRETLAYTGTMQEAIRSLGGLAALAALRRALRLATAEELSTGADLVHAHWWVPGGLSVPAGAPMVLTSHGTDAALLRRSMIARWIAGPVYRAARVVTAVSRELARWIHAAVGRVVDDSHVQPMPVDVARFRWTVGGGGLIVVARLSSQKRIELAIDAAAQLAGAGRRLPLTIVGDGPARAALERRAAASGLGELVRFIGAVPPEDVAALLAAADLMLFPASGEGFGLAAAEALMSGVPVVACRDGGGLLDVVPSQGAGRLVSPTAQAIANAASALLDDPDARLAARAAGEEWRRRLEPSHVAEVCHGWYREALARNG